MAGEQRDLADVASLGVRGQVADCRVLRHALAQWGQVEAPVRNRMACAAVCSRSMFPQREPVGKPDSAGVLLLADRSHDRGEAPYRRTTSTGQRLL